MGTAYPIAAAGHLRTSTRFSPRLPTGIDTDRAAAPLRTTAATWSDR
jgi:hypothetical protein